MDIVIEFGADKHEPGVATPAAELYSFGESRPTAGAGNDARSLYRSSWSAVEASSSRWTQRLARGRALKLSLNNLFDAVRPNFDYAFVVNFTGSSYTQHVLTGQNRVENYPA